MSGESDSGQPPFKNARANPFPMVPLLRGLAGAAVGGVAGFFAVMLLSSQGFYSAILPGPLMGIGFGMAARKPSNLFGIICAIIALPVSLWIEWKFHPFLADPSLEFFLQNIWTKPVNVIMHGLGILGAFWFGRGR